MYHLRLGELYARTNEHCFVGWTYERAEATSYPTHQRAMGWYQYLLGTNPMLHDALSITLAPVAPAADGGRDEPQAT